MADGITFAGRPVLLDIKDQLRDYIEKRFHHGAWPFEHRRNDIGDSTNPFMRKNRQGLFDNLCPVCPSPKVNELINPTGASRYGRAIVIVDSETLADISPSLWGSPSTGMLGDSTNAATLKYDYNGKSVECSMYSLAPIKIDGNSELWMLPLVDKRYFFNRRTSSLDFSSITTWQSLVDAIADMLGVTITISGSVDPKYGVPDKEFLRDSNLRCGNALDVIAQSIGRRFIVVDGEYKLTTASLSDSELTANNVKAQAALITGGIESNLPIQSSLKLICRKSFDYWGNADDPFQAATTIDTGSSSLAMLPVYSSFWLEHFTSELSGNTELDATSETLRFNLADQIAADHLLWKCQQFRFTCAGIVEFIQSGHDDYLAVTCDTARDDRWLTTSLVSLPPNFGPKVNICQKLDAESNSPSYVYIHPHDIARFTITDKIEDNDDFVLGLIIKAEGEYNSGEVRKIPIRPVAVSTAQVGGVIVCAYEHGRGWYQIDGGKGSGKIKFRATADIAYRTLPIVVLNSDISGVDNLDEFNVYDPNNLWSSATKGCIDRKSVV